MPPRHAALLLLASVSCLLPAAARAADPTYAAQLIQEAEARHLQDSPEWRALLHYLPDWISGGYTSEAVTPAFFLSPQGRNDPRQELEATIRSFFDPPPAAGGDAGTQCLFIARYQWLKQQLQFDPARLLEYPCPEFAHWYAAIDPGTLVLIFPAAYLNNPSSMYGHTFLRFDHPGQSEQTHLESYAVNFAAQTTDTNGVVFAFKGLTGLYPGAFSLEPYYRKVKDYSDIENRDIWEYELNYSPEEIRRILEHVWELRQVAFPYYFFNKNCSYALLALLDVARPDTPLTRGFGLQAIPSDTAKAVLAQPGILRRTVYRPSLFSRVNNHLHGMPESDQRLAVRLERGEIQATDPAVTALPPPRAAAVYDTASDYLLYEGNRGDLPREDYGPRSLAILRARAALTDVPVAAPVPVPDTDPVTGHGSARLAFGLGSLDGNGYVEAGVRAAYHDLLDPPRGFVDGAQIEMFALGLRADETDHAARLEYLDLVNIRSFSPRNLFFTPFSWQIGAGWKRTWIAPDRRPLMGDVHGGMGFSWQAGDPALLYVLADATLLTGGGIADGHDVGIGPEAGLLWHVNDRWNLQLDAGYQRYARHLHFTSVKYGVDQNFMLTRDLSLRLGVSRQGDIHAPVNEVSLNLLWYF